MTTIHHAYRHAFRMPLIIAGAALAVLSIFIVGTVMSSHSGFFTGFTQQCIQSFTTLFTRSDIGTLTALSVLVLMVSIFVISINRQWLVTRRFLRSLTCSSLTLHGSAQRVIVVDDETVQCFCAGFLKPNIYVSKQTIESLTREELTAVLAHEEIHRRNRDPFRSALLRALANAFFFLPLVRSYEQRYHEAKEIMADAAALTLPHGQRSLAAALYTLAQHPQQLRSPALAFFADRTLLDIRIAFMQGHVYIPLPITMTKVIVSAIVLAIPLFFFVAHSRAETAPLEPCQEARVIETLPAPIMPLRYSLQ